MKLPEGIVSPYSHALLGEAALNKLVEAVVRDCAAVCRDFDWERHVSPRQALEQATLKRYDLKEKP